MGLKLGVKVGLIAVLTAATGTAAYAAYETGVIDTVFNKDGVEVGDFVGKDKRIADLWAKKNDMTDSLDYSYEYSEDYKENIVMKQSVKSGKKVSPKSKLKLTVSKGYDPDKEFEFPDFTDKKKEDIEAWFTDNHFTSVTYAYEAVEDSSKEEDSFISASVEKGTKVKRSEAIEIKLVTKEIVVPDLASMSREDIQAWGDQWGVTINFVEQEDAMREEGSIISVSAAKDSKIKQGESITVTIAKKKDQDSRTEEEANYQTKDNNSNGGTRDSDTSYSSNTSNTGGENSRSDSTPSNPQTPSTPVQVCPVSLDVSDLSGLDSNGISSGISYLLKQSNYASCPFGLSNQSGTTSSTMRATGWYSDGYSGTVYIVDDGN